MLAIFTALILQVPVTQMGILGPYFSILGTPGLHFDGDPIINMWTPGYAFQPSLAMKKIWNLNYRDPHKPLQENGIETL